VGSDNPPHFFSGGEMLDSLDLAELQEYIKEIREIEYHSKTLMRNVLFWSFVLAMFAFLGESTNREKTIQYLVSAAYLVSCPFIFPLSLPLLLAYRNDQISNLAYDRYSQHTPRFVVIAPISLVYAHRFIITFWVFIACFMMSLHFLGLQQSFLLLMLTAFLILLPRLALFLIKLWIGSSTLQEGLTRIKIARRLFPFSSDLPYIHAGLLTLSSNLPEAEQQLRISLSKIQPARNHQLVRKTFGLLSEVLILDERGEEALPLMESMIRAFPNNPYPYGTLAEYYFRKGIYPERELEIIEFALDNLGFLAHTIRVPLQISKAHALALLGQNNEANEILDEAIQPRKTFTPIQQAEIYRLVGCVRCVQGDETAAREFFTKAVQLDPHGLYGKLAQKALESTLSN
jgi:tetratricopeptide (TPR) repeat protein